MTLGQTQNPTWSLGLFILVTLFASRLTLADLSEFDNRDELSDFSKFVENFIETQTMPAGKTVGLGVTVVNTSGSKPFYAKGFGYRDKENNLLIDEYTLFPIASITKSFVSVLAVKILSQKFPQYGEQVLEIPVQDLLPSNSRLNWTLSDRYRTEKISFRDLLSHRACTTHDLSGPQYGAINDHTIWNRARYEQEACPFRTAGVYNNLMYILAGHLIGEIAEQPFKTLMKDLLLELGMTRSGLSNFTEDYSKMPNFIQAYYLDDNNEIVKGEANLYRQSSITKPAGGIYTTLTDIAKYMTFHMNAGQVDGKEILTKEQHSWIEKIAIPAVAGVSYGLGLVLVYVPGEQRPMLNHNGYYPPYQAEITIFPSLGISVFSATSGPGSITPSDAAKALHNAIFDYFLDKKAEQDSESPSRKLAKEALQKLSWVPRESLFPSFSPDKRKIEKSVAKELRQGRLEPGQAVGKFGAAVQGEIEVSYKNESLKTLQLTYGTWGQADLTQIDDQGWLYKINWTSPIVMFDRSYYDLYELENILEFKGPDLAVFRYMAGFWLSFERNLTLANLPEIPWDENSCGAK